MGQRIWKARMERLAQTLEDKADTARWFPLSVAGWTASILICTLARVLFDKSES